MSSTDVVIVGVGNKIGLPFDIAAATDVRHVYLGGTRVASPTVATGAQTSSVDVSGSTYNGAKVLLAFVQPLPKRV
jgi:hypothetical protein